jgi:hypothetical protein
MSALTLTFQGNLSIPDAIVSAWHLAEGQQVKLRFDGTRIILEKEEPAIPKAWLVKDAETGRMVLTRSTDLPPITSEMVADIIHDTLDIA